MSPMSCNCFGTRSDALRDDHYTPLGMHNPQPTAPGDELVVLSKDGNIKPVNLALTQDGLVVLKSKKGEYRSDTSATCTRQHSMLTLARPRLPPHLAEHGHRSRSGSLHSLKLSNRTLRNSMLRRHELSEATLP